MNKPLVILSSVLIGISIVISILGVYAIDGSRTGYSYSVRTADDPSASLAYSVWDPLVANRSDKVIFCYPGFCAQQAWMNPMMRELTGLGYHVVTVDLRGQGQSSGLYSDNLSSWLQDFDTVVQVVKTANPTWNWTAVALIGHSVGGMAVSYFGNQRSFVHTTVGIDPAGIAPEVNTTNPKNYMVIIGQQDQFLGPSVLLPQYQSVFIGAKTNQLYQDPTTGYFHEVGTC